MYSVGRNGPSASSWTPHLRTRRSDVQRFEEAKSWLHRQIPVARRVLGEEHKLTLKMRCNYAISLNGPDGATLDDLREAVTTLEEIKRTARRVLGGAHPLVEAFEVALRCARATCDTHNTPPPPPGAA